MNDNNPNFQEPTDRSTRRRSFFGVLLVLALFYLAVFSALNLLRFEFPMPILYSLFFLIAVPFALVTVGLVHFTYLVRVQLGSTSAKAPGAATLVSLFVGTTVLISAYFVAVYPEWRQAAAKTWADAIEERLPDSINAEDREELALDVQDLWSKYWNLIELEGADAAEQNPELTVIFQKVVSAVTSDGLDKNAYLELRRVVPRQSAVTTTSSPPSAPEFY